MRKRGLWSWKIDIALRNSFIKVGDEMKDQIIKRGDIYYADLNPVVGSEQGYYRPVLIVSNNAGNKHSQTVVVVPLTCKLKKKSLPTHVFIPFFPGIKTDSMALAEHIKTIDRSRLDEYVGRIDDILQPKIDAALAISIGIDKNHSNSR